jgi:hypothetical protein
VFEGSRAVVEGLRDGTPLKTLEVSLEVSDTS